MENKTFVEEGRTNTSNIVCRTVPPQSLPSRHRGTSHSSPSRHQLSRHIFLNLTDGLKSLSFQRWFYFWEKPEGTGHQIWAVGGLSNPGDLMFHQKTARDVMHEWACCCEEAASHQCFAAVALLSHPSSFCRRMFRPNPKLFADSLLYSLSHFECGGHTVHTLTQRHLPPPLTSAVKSSLLTHAHSSPLFLATRLHWCHTNHSHCNNNGWTFSKQTSYISSRDSEITVPYLDRYMSSHARQIIF